MIIEMAIALRGVTIVGFGLNVTAFVGFGRLAYIHRGKGVLELQRVSFDGFSVKDCPGLDIFRIDMVNLNLRIYSGLCPLAIFAIYAFGLSLH